MWKFGDFLSDYFVQKTIFSIHYTLLVLNKNCVMFDNRFECFCVSMFVTILVGLYTFCCR